MSNLEEIAVPAIVTAVVVGVIVGLAWLSGRRQSPQGSAKRATSQAPTFKLSAIPKPKLIFGIVAAGIVNLLIFTSVVVGVTNSDPAGDPTPGGAPPRLSTTTPTPTPTTSVSGAPKGTVLYALHRLKVRDAASTVDGYERDKFGQKWADIDRNGCDQRNDVLRRDMVNLHTVPGTRGCFLAKGTLSLLDDSYAATRVKYKRGNDKVEIDHVVSLADAWGSGAHDWDVDQREEFANDFMNLEVIDSGTDTVKSDLAANDWLPDDDDDQCALVVRQISIKKRYKLSVTPAELQAMDSVLHSPVCDGDSIKPQKAKEFKVPKPKPIGEPKPKPKPKPTPERSTEPEEPSEPSVRRGVHPGAFCSPAGAPGVTSKGTAMVCKGPGQPRWRAR
jgi:hypothetical protein